MKDYLMELAKLSGKCLVVFIFAYVFFSTAELNVDASVLQAGTWWDVRTFER